MISRFSSRPWRRMVRRGGTLPETDMNPFYKVAEFPDFSAMTPAAAEEALPKLFADAKAAVESYLAGTLAPRADFKCNHHHHEDRHTCGGHHNDGDHACGGHCHH